MTFQVNNNNELKTINKSVNNNFQTNKINTIDEKIAIVEEFANANDKYLQSLPPLEYEYRYMPNLVNGKIDKSSLLKEAYNEMGEKEINVKDFEEKFLFDKNMTAEPLDINKDGKIDINEYSANILATDVLSKDKPSIRNIDGTVNKKGLNTILAYTQKANAAAATKLYSDLYNTYGLNKNI